jgi:RNA polymerase sigma factor (TIGR02999 family)
MTDISHLLEEAQAGSPLAAEQLLPVVYEELRQLAAIRLMREEPGQTLQATALVHEAFLKLVGEKSSPTFANRRHFFAAAAEAMRQILVDQARRKLTEKHGGNLQRLDQLPQVQAKTTSPAHTLAIHDLLDRFTAKNPRAGEIAKMRLFLEMSFKEMAELLGVSADTAEADWAYARAWLQREWRKEA